MEKYLLKSNYEYYHFNTQKEYFEYVEKFLNEGYIICDTIHLSVELCKNNHYVLLSFEDIKKINNIKEALKELEKSYQIVKPDYDHTTLNTIASIKNHFNGKYDYKLDDKMNNILKEKAYQNIVILLLDGLGKNVLEKHLDEASFLRKHYAYTNISIYPPTTTAATTSIISGLEPIETGWFGWENYFKEINQNIILFNGLNYYTGIQTGLNAYKALPYVPFFTDLAVEGKVILPDFSDEKKKYAIFSNSLEAFDLTKRNVQYVYCTEPDYTLHEFGCGSKEAFSCIKDLDKMVEEYASGLPEDTLLIITADHGHTNVKPIDLYCCNTILKRLKRAPTNEARSIVFNVLEEYKETFCSVFNSLFGKIYDIYPTKELIDKHYFGKHIERMHPRALEFLGDFIAIAKGEYYFNYKDETNFIMKSHHAGMTKDEMEVPIIIFRR